MEMHRKKYEELFDNWGYNENALIMPSDRRNIRYYELLKNSKIFEMTNCNGYRILDAGCGFGNVIDYLHVIGKSNFSYTGIDVVDSFLEEGRIRHSNVDGDYKFLKRDLFIESVDDLDFDFAISSQAFNWKYDKNEEQNYDVIFTIIAKLFRKSNDGVAFNFFSDKVQYMKEDTAYHNPGRILEFAYSLSNNIIIDNTCMPYEPTVAIFKDNCSSGGVFDVFRLKHIEEFKNKVFVIKDK